MSKNKSVVGGENNFEDEFWYKNKSDKFFKLSLGEIKSRSLTQNSNINS